MKTVVERQWRIRDREKSATANAFRSQSNDEPFSALSCSEKRRQSRIFHGFEPSLRMPLLAVFQN